MGLSSSNQNTPGQINTLTSHTHTLKHTILFVFSRISAPTHHCGLAQLGGKNGRSPWQRFVPFCYSCDVCGDTFDPLVNSVMQELCRVRIDPGSPAYPATIVQHIGVLLALYDQGTMTIDYSVHIQANKIRTAYLCHGN